MTNNDKAIEAVCAELWPNGDITPLLRQTVQKVIEAYERVNGWQPIETAPKDGTPLLLSEAGFTQKQVQKLVDALEFYANDDNRGLKQMGTFNGGVVMCDEYVHDNGKRAKEALAAFEKGV